MSSGGPSEIWSEFQRVPSAPGIVSMVDTTRYPSVDGTPELAVRQIMVRARVPETLRLALAGKNLLDADAWAVVGESLSDFKENISRLMSDQIGQGADREANLICLSAAWRKCRALAEGRDTRRARLEEDPHRIPEMGLQDSGREFVWVSLLSFFY